MGAVCVLAPVVVAAWPAFSAAIAAAATSLGYTIASDAVKAVAPKQPKEVSSVTLEIERSEVVTGNLGRGQRMSVIKNGVTVVFSRDARGQASLCVTGDGHTETELRTLGGELSHAVVQHYVYQKLIHEMKVRGFTVVDEQQNEDRSIQLRVRHWEG